MLIIACPSSSHEAAETILPASVEEVRPRAASDRSVCHTSRRVHDHVSWWSSWRLCQCVLLLVTVCRYIISVNDDHVVPVLPYISDTGGKAPESCIFSLLLSIAALLGELTNSAAPVAGPWYQHTPPPPLSSWVHSYSQVPTIPSAASLWLQSTLQLVEWSTVCVWTASSTRATDSRLLPGEPLPPSILKVDLRKLWL